MKTHESLQRSSASRTSRKRRCAKFSARIGKCDFRIRALKTWIRVVEHILVVLVRSAGLSIVPTVPSTARENPRRRPYGGAVWGGVTMRVPKIARPTFLQVRVNGQWMEWMVVLSVQSDHLGHPLTVYSHLEKSWSADFWTTRKVGGRWVESGWNVSASFENFSL